MLSHRVDAPLPGTITRQETFGYDDLDRLTTVRHGLPPGSLAMSMSYAANGNITGKTGLGKYTYDSSKPHAVTEIENTGNLLNPRGQSIEYNALNKAHILIDTVDNDAYRLEITCGPDGQRWKTVLQKNGNITKTVIFAGDYEKITEDGVTRELIYLPGGGVYVRQAGQADKIYYTHTDHLGSVISITDGNGAEVFKASYDAWGKQTITNNTFKFHRGYTGHEHLPEFGLINMNGRMYDPIVGRFLSPDPFVQAPEFSQSFNRYSYALNNPLIYTDPTGEIVWFVPVIVGSIIGGTSGAIITHNNGGKWWQGALVGATIGGLSGGAAAGISALGGGSTIAGAAAGGIGGAGFSGMATGWDKNAMLTGFANGAISGFIGGGFASAIGGGWGALAGGATSNLTNQLLYNDGNFSKVDWKSVGVSAAVSFGMYHGMQYMQYRTMGGKLGGQDVTYRQFSKINTAYQRSNFWRREFGVYLNADGSAKITPWKDTHKFSVDFRSSQGNVNKTAHAHWAKGGQEWVELPNGGYQRYNGDPTSYPSGSSLFETVGGYHSPADIARLPGTSFVVGGTSSSYLTHSMRGWSYIYPDPYIRFFLFPYLSFK